MGREGRRRRNRRKLKKGGLTKSLFYVILSLESEVDKMYKEYMIPNNEKGRKLLAELKKQNKTIIISRKINLYKVKIKVNNIK